MPNRPTGQDYTVLDFINRPNPVEPTTAPPKHPLHNSAQLNAGYSHDLRRLLLSSGPRESSGEASAKRRKAAGDGTGNVADQARDLPKLPARPGGHGRVRRARLPPTLSGLHQPPPNAGLLPSISVEKPKDSESASGTTECEISKVAQDGDTARASHSQANAKSGKPGRNKWSDDETACLLKGVARFGIGSWTKILKCEDYRFERRTALDLKDRFRVCCPDHYKKPKPRRSDPESRRAEPPATEHSKSQSRGGKDRKDTSELARMGIEAPFERSARRSRHGWTEAEDQALWDGFNKHGKSWASIQHDDSLRLSHRTPTDLRDRLRQRYPEAYARTGLAPRPEVFPAPPDRTRKMETPESTATKNAEKLKKSHTAGSLSSDPRRADRLRTVNATNRNNHAPPPFLPNDVFFGMPAEDEEFDPEPIVLDRGILDWALDSTKPSQQEVPTHFGDSGSQLRHLYPAAAASNAPLGNSSSGALPSLATITAANDDYTDLELPSLMQYISPLEADGRGSGHGFLSLEDLLQSQAS